jgi:hypothetical protein
MPRNENSLANVECQDLVEELANRMDLKDEEREKFTHRCMTRAGYTAVPQYVKPENEGKGRTRSRQSNDDW